MKKNFKENFNFYSNIILCVIIIIGGIGYSVGFHTANEIISGTFLGNYIFQNNVTFEKNITLNSNKQCSGRLITNENGFVICQTSLRNFVVSGTVGYLSPPGPVSYSNVVENTLFSSNPPTTTSITIQENGTYLVSLTFNVCQGGATGYINSQIYLNGNTVSGSVNEAQECGGATATTVLNLKTGDILEGKIKNSNTQTGNFLFTLTKLI